MYNFFDRIKAPLNDYRKYNAHKKDDDFIEIEEQIANGTFPNEYGSNAIDIPSHLNHSPYSNVGVAPPNILKQSQYVSFVNPLSLPSSLIPPPPSYGNINASSRNLSDAISASDLRGTTISFSPPSNVVTVPASEVTSPPQQPTVQAVTGIYSPPLQASVQQSHLLPHSELKNNNSSSNNNDLSGDDNDNDYLLLMDQSNKLQLQMQLLMQKMQQMQQIKLQLQLQQQQQQQPTQAPQSSKTDLDESSTNIRQRRFQMMPQQSQQFFNNHVEHEIPHSKRVEMEDALKSTATEIEMTEFNNNNNNRFAGGESTFYNPNFNKTTGKLDESTINVDSQQHEKGKDSNSQSVTISPTIRNELNSTTKGGDIILNIDDEQGKTIISTTQVTPTSSPNQLVGEDEHSPSSIVSGDPNVVTTQQQGRSTIKMVIPRIKSKLNREKMERFKKSVFQVLLPSNNTVPVHIVDADQTEGKVVPFLMELGRALIMSGVPSHRLEFELTLISSTFGLDGHFFTTPTGIFFSFGSPHTILSPYTHFLRINSTDYNMERMIRLEALADKVIYGEVTCVEALEKLRKILQLKPLYNIYFTTFSYIMSSFTIAFFFNTGWLEVGVCSVIGLYVGLLCLLSSKFSPVGRVLESLAACGGAIIASLFNCFITPVPVFLVTLGGIIALLPGLGLTLAVAEISTRNLVSGTSRIVGVFSCLLQLTFGIVLGTKFSEVVMPLREEVEPIAFPSWVMYIVIPVAAISFGVQLKVHWKHFWVIIIASYLGVTCGNWGSKYFGGDIGSFFGSCAICALGNLYSRFSNISAVVPIMAGIILLVPGSLGIKGLVGFASGDIDGGTQFLQGMFMVAVSLTIGLLVANLIVPPPKAL